MARGLRTDAKGELIASVPLFAGLSKKELKEVASIADELDFRANKVLIREGEAGREFFILVEGSAEVTRDDASLRTMRPGDFFGEIALLCDLPRTATVTTTTPSAALVVTDRHFKALVKRSPDIALKVLRAVAERLPADEA